MDFLNDLYLLTRVVEARGFSAAERETGIPKSRLSRRLSALEERLGTRLLHRSAQGFAMTPTGETVYRHAKSMLIEAEAAEAAAQEAISEPSGMVRLHAPVLMGEFVLSRLLSEFAGLHPKVRFTVLLGHRPPELIQDRIDLALRIAVSGELEATDAVARRLGQVPLCLVASPALVRRYGILRHPGDLDGFQCLGLTGMEGGFRWSLRSPGGEPVEFDFNPRFATDNAALLKTTALAGGGIAQLPRYACGEDIAAGRLVEILSDWAPAPATIYGLYPSRRGATSAVRQLLSYLASALPAALAG
ncbi:MAG TPA: LysR family transcriptional regulator [Stellaceae bacterium]|nr:LysR family transcriptional regulator [Stellaceae bacterium]